MRNKPLTKMEYEYALGLYRDRLADFLPYESYDSQTGYYISLEEDDCYVGKIFECVPFPFAGEDQLSAIVQVIESNLPENSVIQFILFADPRIEHITSAFVNLRLKGDEKNIDWYKVVKENNILKPEEISKIEEEMEVSGEDFKTVAIRLNILSYEDFRRIEEQYIGISKIWAKKFAYFLNEHTEKGFYTDVPVPIRNFRLLIAVKVVSQPNKIKKTIKDIESSIVNIKSSLETSLFYPKDLNQQELINFLWWWLNPDSKKKPPKYNPNVELKYQVISPNTLLKWRSGANRDYLHINKRNVSVMTAISYPDKIHIFNLSKLLGDYMQQNLKQIACPFVVSLTLLKKKANSKIRMWAERTFAQRSTGVTGLKISEKQKEAAGAIYQMEEQKQDYYYFALTLIMYSKPENTLRDVNIVKTIWEKQDVELIEESIYPIVGFLYCLPFGVRTNPQVLKYMQKRLKPAPMKSIAHIAPVQAEWTGAGCKPAMLFVSRRGQLVPFDLFSGSETNYNAVIYAQSRAGKSFLANYIITCYRGLNAKVWVIDVGRSYEKICKFLGGVFLEFKIDSDICLNPFTNTTNIDESLESLSALIQKMARPASKCTEEEVIAIKEAIKGAWDQYGQEATITHVSDFLSKRGKKTHEKLAYLLSDYCVGGAYAKYFDGPANIDLNMNDFIVLELEELSSNPELRNVILMLLMYQIQETAYMGNKQQEKLVIIDEGWQFFKNDDENTGMAKFIETGFRRIAKYTGSFIVITQGLDDLYSDNNSVGAAIIANSAHQFILKQKPSVIDALAKDKKISFEEGIINYIKSVHTRKGKYSEIFLQVDGQIGGIVRLFVDPFTYAFFTTDGEKVDYLNELIKKGYTLELAIEEAIRTDYGGKSINKVEISNPDYIENMNKLIEFLKTAKPATINSLLEDIKQRGLIYEEIYS